MSMLQSEWGSALNSPSKTASGTAVLLGAWNTKGESIVDLNDDLIVNGEDLAILLGAWGPC